MTAMDNLLFITWNPDLFAFHLGGFGVRWYSLCWCFALLAAYVLVQRLYRQQHIADKLFDPLFFYCFVGILVGARLGHCLFYEPGYFLAHPLEMILPMRQTANGWTFTGYAGLASHGGTIGLMLALWLYVRKTKLNIMRVLDNIAIATPASAMFIRLGNLMNSEIIGKPTDVPWAFIFEREDMLPRHPAQLYEAIAYFIFFLGMVYLYKRGQKKQESKLETDFSTTKAKSTAVQAVASLPYHRGFFFGLCLTEIFVFRFFIEFLKEDQVDFEKTMALNMGQWLSVPFILIGIYFMCFYGKKTAGK